MTGSKNWVDTIPYLVPSGGISDPYPHDKEIHTLAHYFDRSKAEKADVCIFGVPYDGDMPPTAMASSRAGPDAIRNKLRAFRPYSNNQLDRRVVRSLVALSRREAHASYSDADGFKLPDTCN